MATGWIRGLRQMVEITEYIIPKNSLQRIVFSLLVPAIPSF